MSKLIYTEFLKLKRSGMFLVSILGAIGLPFMCFIGYLINYENSQTPILFTDIFAETNMYVTLLSGTLLYGIITAYIFNREYSENTLKNILSISISKISFIVSKFIILFVWIMLLTVVSWSSIFMLGIAGNFNGVSVAVLAISFRQFFTGGCLLFLLSAPTVFIVLKFKGYVQSIIFTALVTMINILVINSRYMALYPWSAALVIANNMKGIDYPIIYSYISIIATAILGFTAAINHFLKEDI